MSEATFKETCIKLRKKDFTLNEIVKITGRPKTSVYFHIKGVDLSKQKQRQIAKKATERMVAYSNSIKGKSFLGRSPKKFTAWSENTVALVSHLMFDGEIKRGSCVYTNSNGILTKKVEGLMKSVYIFSPHEYNPTPGVKRISYHNVELAAYLKQKAEELLENTESLPKNFQKKFLRAFFDDEGSVYFIKNKRLVRGFQHDFEILCTIKKLLLNFGIESKIDKKYNEITISRKENLVRFRDEINFTPGVKVNGKRSNSIWKKDLEKRKILDMAINSYKN